MQPSKNLLLVFCVAAMLFSDFAAADDWATTQKSVANQWDPDVGTDHFGATQELAAIQIYPWNGDGYLDHGVQKTYRTPMVPAYRTQKRNVHIDTIDPSKYSALGMEGYYGVLPEDCWECPHSALGMEGYYGILPEDCEDCPRSRLGMENNPNRYPSAYLGMENPLSWSSAAYLGAEAQIMAGREPFRNLWLGQCHGAMPYRDEMLGMWNEGHYVNSSYFDAKLGLVNPNNKGTRVLTTGDGPQNSTLVR
jgi:hypothetical protein